MINFDNSATSFPKPAAVRAAVSEAVSKYGGNPGRSGHSLSMQAAAKVYEVRRLAAEMFASQTENAAFTANATFALNMAIKGIMQYGGHIIISSYEHNAVLRPVYALSQTRGVEFSIAEVTDDDEETIANIRELIRPDTKCICCMAASNVTGRILPYRLIGELARERDICFICDCSQAAGVIPVSLSDGINILCTSGHKGLYGPAGTGLLITDGRFPLSTIIEGGTGSLSMLPEQPADMPERLESGTLNTVGIIGLGAGLLFVKNKGLDAVRQHEEALCQRFITLISRREDVKVYRSGCSHLPIVAFNVGDMSSHEVSQRLSDRGYALRGGLHCAALAHRTLGTVEQGVVRFSPSVFNSVRQTENLAAEILRL